MNRHIKGIWIESEETNPLSEGNEETNDNSDVIVTFEDGSRHVATFFTYQNIEYLRKKNQISGECLSGRYFWASDMLIVDRIHKSEIELIVRHLIAENEFELIFRELKE